MHTNITVLYKSFGVGFRTMEKALERLGIEPSQTMATGHRVYRSFDADLIARRADEIRALLEKMRLEAKENQGKRIKAIGHHGRAIKYARDAQLGRIEEKLDSLYAMWTSRK